MFRGVKLKELDVVEFDGYKNYPFVGDSKHLQEGEVEMS
jgi:hypothetical protein